MGGLVRRDRGHLDNWAQMYSCVNLTPRVPDSYPPSQTQPINLCKVITFPSESGGFIGCFCTGVWRCEWPRQTVHKLPKMSSHSGMGHGALLSLIPMAHSLLFVCSESLLEFLGWGRGAPEGNFQRKNTAFCFQSEGPFSSSSWDSLTLSEAVVVFSHD